MEERTFQGRLAPEGIAQVLLDEWDQGATIAQAFGEPERVIVQIGQREAGWFGDEPRQAITLDLHAVDEGVEVVMGQQQWYRDGGTIMVGGLIGFLPFFFTFPLGRLFGGDDIDASLPGKIWQTIERATADVGAATGKTQRLVSISCPECGVANPQGAAHCSACGTALAAPSRCVNCGHDNPPGAQYCNRCGVGLTAEPSGA
jgi:ribosomal protein L40E